MAKSIVEKARQTMKLIPNKDVTPEMLEGYIIQTTYYIEETNTIVTLYRKKP